MQQEHIRRGQVAQADRHESLTSRAAGKRNKFIIAELAVATNGNQRSRLVRIRYDGYSRLALIAPYGGQHVGAGWYVVMEFDPPIRLPRLNRHTWKIVEWCIEHENITGTWPTIAEIGKHFGITNRQVSYHFVAARNGIWRGNRTDKGRKRAKHEQQ